MHKCRNTKSFTGELVFMEDPNAEQRSGNMAK